MKTRSALLTVLFALLTAAPALAGPAEEVAAAERAFAAHAQRDGSRAAFLASAAPDGLLFSPDPSNARAQIERWPAADGGRLTWGPEVVAASRSGDVGLSTGPFVMRRPNFVGRGYFFTIWRRQPDGGWRWVIDKGVHAPASATHEAPAENAPVRVLAASTATPVTAAEALSRVQALKTALHAAAATDSAAAFRPRLAADVRLAADGRAPGRAGRRRRLSWPRGLGR